MDPVIYFVKGGLGAVHLARALWNVRNGVVVVESDTAKALDDPAVYIADVQEQALHGLIEIALNWRHLAEWHTDYATTLAGVSLLARERVALVDPTVEPYLEIDDYRSATEFMLDLMASVIPAPFDIETAEWTDGLAYSLRVVVGAYHLRRLPRVIEAEFSAALRGMVPDPIERQKIIDDATNGLPNVAHGVRFAPQGSQPKTDGFDALRDVINNCVLSPGNETKIVSTLMDNGGKFGFADLQDAMGWQGGEHKPAFRKLRRKLKPHGYKIREKMPFVMLEAVSETVSNKTPN